MPCTFEICLNSLEPPTFHVKRVQNLYFNFCKSPLLSFLLFYLWAQVLIMLVALAGSSETVGTEFSVFTSFWRELI